MSLSILIGWCKSSSRFLTLDGIPKTELLSNPTCKVLMLFDRRNFSEYLGRKLCYLVVFFLNFLTLKMSKNREHFRHILFYFFRRCKRRYVVCTVRVPLTIPRAVSAILAMHHVLDDRLRLMATKY